MADAFTERAERLLDLWSNLALRHVALGGSCACGAGGVSLRLEDFELDIVDYLFDGGVRCDAPEVAAWFHDRQGLVREARPIQSLLDLVLAGHMPKDVAAWAMPRLERTLGSFAELHGASAA